jgi:ABC-2 type transport system ATP-binding protein
MSSNRTKKIEELSKGNQQKVQFLATILHDPTILVMDEPFSGLDPVNANVLKEAFFEMHHRGKTIIFSTHQLEQAEELCQEIVIINKGQSVVQGSVREVKRQQGRQVVRLKLENDPEASWLEQILGVQVSKRREDYIEMHIQANFNPNVIVESALHHGGIISRFELTEPSLTDIFIEKVGGVSKSVDPSSVLSA